MIGGFILNAFTVEGRKVMFGDNYVRPASHVACKMQEIMLPMRDGIKLRTLIFLPEGNNLWPVSLTRNCYPNYEDIERFTGEEYAKRGIGYVVQFCRGKAGSEGVFEPNISDRDDGIDTVNWLAKQDWASAIGIQGESYMAFTSWIIADCLPEKVKTMCCIHYGIDRHQSLYKSGLFRHDIMTGWTMSNAGVPIHADYLESCRFRPHVEVDEVLWRTRLDWYRDWITNTDADSPYWQKGVWGILKNIPPKVNIPIMIFAGFYDHHMDGTLLSYELLKPEVKSCSKLVIGAWNHSHEPVATMHHPVNNSRNIIADIFNWFDDILVRDGQPTGSIESYIIGDDQWVKLEQWPISTSDKETFYLSPRKEEGANHCSLNKALSEHSVIHYKFDPDNPVISIGGETLYVTENQRGSKLQPAPCYRDDVLSFVSPPLVKDVRIAGNVNVKLFVCSEAKDTCFAVKLCEVLPDGNTYNIRSSITTLAYRNGRTKRGEYIPNTIVSVNVELSPIMWNIKKGSCIRLDVTSSNFPEYAVHTNNAGIWSEQDTAIIAQNSIYCGETYPSEIEIPIML